MVIFVGFMLGMAFRSVAYNTLTTKAPRPPERARFSSIQSSVQHLASALGAFAAAHYLTVGPDRMLIGVQTMAFASIALGFVVIPFFWIVESRVMRASAVPVVPP